MKLCKLSQKAYQNRKQHANYKAIANTSDHV
jgi:hypothetical protein